MIKPVLSEYRIQKDARAGFLSRFESNWQSTLSPKQANDNSLYSFKSKLDDIGGLKISAIPEDSHSSRSYSPKQHGINNIISKKKS